LLSAAWRIWPELVAGSTGREWPEGTFDTPLLLTKENRQIYGSGNTDAYDCCLEGSGLPYPCDGRQNRAGTEYTFLARIDVLKTRRDTRRDCGKRGCPNDIPPGMHHEATSKSRTFLGANVVANSHFRERRSGLRSTAVVL
jgi:hypothetical protein